MSATPQTQIVRRVRVNRARLPQEIIHAMKRWEMTTPIVVDSMPRGVGEEVDVVFFKPDLQSDDGIFTSEDVEKEFERRVLKPADPYSLAAANEEDPTLARTHPNFTFWKDAEGKECYIAFVWWGDVGSRIFVAHSGNQYCDDWWCVGLPK